MSRYRSSSMIATAAPLQTIDAPINDFLLYHERQGDSPSYLAELRSYLIGGGGNYGTKRMWKPLLPWADGEGLSCAQDFTREKIGAYLDHVRGLANRRERTRRNRMLLLDTGMRTSQLCTRNGLFQLLQKWGRLANLTETRCSPPTFRHFCAVQYLRAGGDIVSLQRILGHSRLDVTERYLKFVSSDIVARHRRFNSAAQFTQGHVRAREE